jgi:hypothetical protein
MVMLKGSLVASAKWQRVVVVRLLPIAVWTNLFFGMKLAFSADLIAVLANKFKSKKLTVFIQSTTSSPCLYTWSCSSECAFCIKVVKNKRNKMLLLSLSISCFFAELVYYALK